MAGLIFIVAAISAVKTRATAVHGWIAATFGFLAVACMTLYRDGLRDVTLGLSNFDVWDRQVVANWSVVGTFLVLFVVSLGVAGWLISVMMRAKPVSEKVMS